MTTSDFDVEFQSICKECVRKTLFATMKDQFKKSKRSQQNMNPELDRELIHQIQHDPKKVRVPDLRAYVRRNGLRINGRKAELIERIQAHVGSAENCNKYPKSTFVVDCTGDVCKGDVVLFRQKVFEKFDTLSRHGEVLGVRKVAGKVLSENYGIKRQQHTFTIEVMWSTGVQALRPMQQLLIKGRNLYRKGTRRQLWSDEKARKRILDKKHERGDSARQIRESRNKFTETVHILKRQKTLRVRTVGRHRELKAVEASNVNGPQPHRPNQGGLRLEMKVADAPKTFSPGQVKKAARALVGNAKRRRAPELPKIRPLQSVQAVVATPTTAAMCVEAGRVRAQPLVRRKKKHKRYNLRPDKNFQEEAAMATTVKMRKAMVPRPFGPLRRGKFRPWLHQRDSFRHHQAFKDPAF